MTKYGQRLSGALAAPLREQKTAGFGYSFAPYPAVGILNLDVPVGRE